MGSELTINEFLYHAVKPFLLQERQGRLLFPRAMDAAAVVLFLLAQNPNLLAGVAVGPFG